MLGPQRETLDLNLNFVQNRAGECGGIVSYVEMSGVHVVGYLTGSLTYASPLGIQLNDVEVMDLSRQWHPALDRRTRRVDRPGTMVGLARRGTYDTNFTAPDCQPYSGRKAYLAQSGLLTHDSNSGPYVGLFMSDLNDSNVVGLPRNNNSVTVFGGGYSREQVFVKTPDGFYYTTQGDTPIIITTPGWVRIKLEL